MVSESLVYKCAQIATYYDCRYDRHINYSSNWS